MIARSLKFFMALLFTLFCTACAGTLFKNYGSFEPDRGITQAFEAYRVSPDLNYYISGSDAYPNAIMGLNKKYTLEESLWKKVQMTPEKLREWVGGMQRKVGATSMLLSGWSMRDEGGRELGVWYSALSAVTSVKLEGDNKVTVYRPPQDIYREAEPDSK